MYTGGMKSFIQFKGGETINVAHIVKFVEQPDNIQIFLSDGTTRSLTDQKAINKFTNELKEGMIFTY
jgi:hypothetical protein